MLYSVLENIDDTLIYDIVEKKDLYKLFNFKSKYICSVIDNKILKNTIHEIIHNDIWNDYDYCKLAISYNPYLLEYIFNKTDELCYIAYNNIFDKTFNTDEIYKKQIKKYLAMNKACSLAYYNIENKGGPFGAVITDKNYNIISEGFNMVTLNNDPSQHAEIVAIQNACKKLNKIDLSEYVLFTSCEPCPMCLSCSYWSSINEIYYNYTKTDAKNIEFNDEFIYDELNKLPKDRKIIMEQIKSNQHDSFNLWKHKTDKIKY
jgi:tRNA(Arg) A34 adenosine deaminase TadA